MRLSLIVAMTKQGVIGKDNQLPWHLPEDLRRFKKITMGCPIIMGRKTFDSIGKVLPGRTNIVLSRDKNLDLPEGVVVCSSIEAALDAVQGADEAFVIGGATIYEQALKYVDRFHVTLIKKTIEGDAYFPSPDILEKCDVVERIERSEPFHYEFIVADKK